MTTASRVLLIDSCEADGVIAALALRDRCARLEVVHVSGALEYAEHLAAADFEAVVCEHQLDWGEGMAVLRQLRRRFPDLPLFLLAAGLPPGVADSAVELRLSACVSKTSGGILDMAHAVCRSLGQGPLEEQPSRAWTNLDDLPVGLFELSAQGVIEGLNARAREVLGRLGDARPGVPLTALFHDLAGDDEWRRLRGGELVRFEGAMTPSGDHEQPYLLRLSRRSGGGYDGMVEPLSAAGAATDSNLAEANAELEQLAYAVSHDLQEPLQLILRNARLLSDRYHEQLRDGGDKFLGHVVESTERMQSMIDGVLAYSRLRTGQRNLQPISVDDILDQVLENLKPQVAASGATLDRHPLPVVRVDRFQIQQLLTNVIGNALKFRGEAPLTITVRAEDKGDEWEFMVRDNGIGFDGRFQERIFRMFQRLHTSEEYPGTGIGLAVSRKIIEQYGGRMWAEAREGEGAAFFFTLPK
ncbi:MAG: ATP-binding protein [Gammaproteobacteria bacterium]|nr:ATP-binding protein [Gammaproteobacteria bacterium]